MRSRLVTGVAMVAMVAACSPGDVDGRADVVSPVGCESPQDPVKQAEKCLVDGYGVYVSPSGNDATGAGTRAAPYKTLGKALERQMG